MSIAKSVYALAIVAMMSAHAFATDEAPAATAPVDQAKIEADCKTANPDDTTKYDACVKAGGVQTDEAKPE